MKNQKSTQTIRKKLTSWMALAAVCALLLVTLSGCGSIFTSGSASRNGTSTVSTYTADADAGFYPEEESLDGYGAAAYGASDNILEELEDAEAGEEDSQKLIRTVNLNVETTDFDTLMEEITDRTVETGGYVESEEISTTEGTGELRRAWLKVRIPEERLDEFLTLVGENAHILYDSESVEDVTLTYVDLETHLDELRTEQQVLESLLEDAESVKDILEIQEQLTEIRYEIESYESQLKVLENRVSYSTVYLDITEVERENAAAGTSFGENVSNRFQNSLYRLRTGFRNFAAAFLGDVLIILLVAAIVAAVVLIVWGCVHRARRLSGALQKRKDAKARVKAEKAEAKELRKEKRAAKKAESVEPTDDSSE